MKFPLPEIIFSLKLNIAIYGIIKGVAYITRYTMLKKFKLKNKQNSQARPYG